MKLLLLWFFDRPRLAAALLVALTAFFAWQLPRLEIDPSAEGLMLERDPAREFYEQVERRFGSDNLTVVLVKADDVFTPAVLGIVKRLTDGLERVEGATRVESLTSVRNIKGDGDTLDMEPLVGRAVPDDPGEIARIRADALGNRVFVGNLVAADARATAITIYTDGRPEDREFNRRFTDQVEALIRGEAAPGVTVYQIGSVITRLANARSIEEDQKRVVPICTLVQMLVLWLAFRTPQGMVIPVSTTLLSILWTLGLMALLRLPMNLLTSIVPALLIAISFAEDVHMISEYHLRLERGQAKLDAIRSMLAEAALPLTITTGTTAVGFATLTLTDVTMLIQFGQAATLGLLANFVVTMLMAPLLMRLWPVPRRLRRAALDRDATDGWIPRLMERLGHFNLRYRVPILVVAGLLAAGSLVGWLNLRVDTDFVSLFPRDSFIRQRIEDLRRSLGGALNFYVVVDTGREDGVKDPQVLRKIAALQDHLAGTGKVAKTVSVADYIRKMHREMNGGDPAFEVVPDSVEAVAQYLLLLEGTELAKFVDFDASGASIVVRHDLTGSQAISDLRREIEGYIAREFPPTLPARPTGEAILTNNAVDFLAVNELQSLWTTFVVIGLIHALLFLSLRAGLLSMIPNVIPVLTTYGLMGLVGIPLDVSTALVATVAIGIAVDDTVHHMVTYNRQLQEHRDQKVAMFNTLRAQGRPIIYVSAALIASFLPLLLAERVSTVHFGLLAAFAMLMAMVGELTLTPILMYSTQLVTLWDALLLKMPADLVRRAPLFEGLSRWEARKVVLLGGLERVRRGDLMIRKGEAGRDMYMVVTGRLRAFDHYPDGRERLLTTLEPGAVFGEVALMNENVRTAHVAADTDADVLRLDEAALERIRRRFPFTGAKVFRNLARVLAERLRRATDALVAAG
ncbi:MAG: efflux RND transporter permease subunit [Candidatus Rokuibacteriota bacterium]